MKRFINRLICVPAVLLLLLAISCSSRPISFQKASGIDETKYNSISISAYYKMEIGGSRSYTLYDENAEDKGKIDEILSELKSVTYTKAKSQERTGEVYQDITIHCNDAVYMVTIMIMDDNTVSFASNGKTRYYTPSRPLKLDLPIYEDGSFPNN